MKMHRILTTSILLLAGASSLLAQRPEIEITARATRMEISGSSDSFGDPEQDFISEFDTDTGFGLGVNVFLTDSFSVETTATLLEPDFGVRLFDDDGPIGLQPVEIIPITLGVQYHIRPVRWLDVYAGVGGAYIFIDDVNVPGNLALEDVGSLEIDDEAGFMANIGVTFELRGSLGLNIDARYLGVEPDASISFIRGDFETDRTIEFNPVLLSAGIAWRF